MTGTAALGTFGVGFEPQANPGKQLIFAVATIAASQSATNQPQGSTGCHISILVQGIVAGSSATVTITGKATDGVTAVTETSTAISTSTANANNVYEYTTTKVFGSIDSSGITASSVTSNALTGATLTAYGIVAAKYLVPATCVIQEDYDVVDPDDLRGIMDRSTRLLQTLKHVTVDSKSAVYPENCEYVALACVANATNPATRASLPASPTSLNASTTFTVLGSPFTLGTQPTSPGMLLQFIIAGNSVAGTLTIAGTNPNGQALSEVISVTTGTPNGTFYTANDNVYASVTNVTVTGFTGAATCVVKGVFAYNPIYNPTNTLFSLSAEWFSGTESDVVSYFVPEEFGIDYDVSKELSLTLKGPAQTKLTVGDRTSTSLTTNKFGPYTQPTDYPIPGWGALFYLDPINGTLGATQWVDVITFKLTGKTGQKPYWTATGSQDYNRTGRMRRETTFECEIDFTNVILYDKYRAFQKQQILIKFQSLQAYLGNNSGPLYKTMQWTLYPKMPKFELNPKDEKVTAKISGTCEYEPSVSVAFALAYINQNNPNYFA